ncbi:hypothetical protein BST97_02900 [Nonlabens spongiae]|uniref:Uncharacterized protein n=1 Tax=Nonlabens spongiae TaxID=331648 RepID=A0A1W6MHG8_9FLAO|nr:carboxypeptidase-like regulatory domain-containing protein [Nonlabens spongiae]ARN77032.1 hypothetical protein BST97_02900 [Nonlabens spongiae]
MTCLGNNSQAIDSLLVTGKVIDPDGRALAGATIQIKGTQKFTVTDFDGEYTIKVLPANTLVFAYTGYENQSILVGNQKIIGVTLQPILEVVAVTAGHPFLMNKIFISKGLNYKVNKIEVDNHKGILPLNFSFSGSIGTDLDNNSSYSYSLRNSIRLSGSRYFSFKAGVENQNFNGLQFHQYRLDISTSFKLLSFNSKYYKDPRIKVILGHLNYDGQEQNESLGIGLGLSRNLFSNLNLSASYTYWDNFNEVKTEALYRFGDSNWSALANYRHLSDYEEFQIGVAYNLNFY